ncbi:hypothetical protein DL98DRAFT_523074 [Cadophora sp. DSE1049]|nr:hypothetical protein DL98DRAFT_523074 [Cadophora sp. DSE1049]
MGDSLPSGEKATDEVDEAKLVWPSSVCSGAPVAVSQSRTVRSPDPDTTCLPSGEKATEETLSVWPSSVWSAAFQCVCTFGFNVIQAGIHPSNSHRTILFPGAKTRAEQYNCKGACSIADRLYKTNRFVSLINPRQSGLLVS